MSKKELKEILKNPKGKLVAIDIDGTLTKPYDFWTEKPEPNEKMIKLCRDIISKGGFVVLYTARTSEMAAETISWLEKHNVWHQGINFGKKPGADLYIDDRCLNIEDCG